MNPRRLSLFAIGTLVALLAASQALAAGNTPNGPKLIKWDVMVGVPAGLTGTQSQTPLRGLSGGGIPWMLASGEGTLSATGKLHIEVEGLVLASGGSAGTNPINMFRGLVSCVNSDGTFQNILTDPFPATTGAASAGGGDSTIDAVVALPSPCIAPIVFVTSPGGSWFAATGN
jgi:hypothetical protein